MRGTLVVGWLAGECNIFIKVDDKILDLQEFKNILMIPVLIILYYDVPFID